MKKVFVLIVWAMLLATSANAAQYCSSGIPLTTPTADFTVHGDGTVTHKRTGLMWKQCVEGASGVDCASGTVSTFTWQAALQHAEQHSFAGYADWRLPNVKELSSIVERSCYDPAINLSVFPNDSIREFLSGSPFASDAEIAWIIDLEYGGAGGHYRSIDSRFGVRLVRGGQ
jgi:hypothetical protein